MVIDFKLEKPGCVLIETEPSRLLNLRCSESTEKACISLTLLAVARASKTQFSE